MVARGLKSLLRMLFAASAQDVTVKRLVVPSEIGNCVATHESNGLLVTKEEAETLIEAGAADRRDATTPTQKLQKRRRDHVVRALRTDARAML